MQIHDLEACFYYLFLQISIADLEEDLLKFEYMFEDKSAFSIFEGDCVLGWQLPWVMPDYPSDILYYPLFAGYVVTPI